MPRVPPLPDWTTKDVYIVGGGHSLRTFDFAQLRGRCVIGCNEAFSLGAEFVSICVFGDEKFWRFRELEKKELTAFQGYVATNYQVRHPPPWLKIYGRIERGLGVGNDLAWNGNTGALAINLALLLGASTVYLLGYDMSMQSKWVTHWHDRRIEMPTPMHYDRFMSGCDTVALHLKDIYPGRKVLNVSDGTSRLRSFPTIGFEDTDLQAPTKEAVPA